MVIRQFVDSPDPNVFDRISWLCITHRYRLDRTKIERPFVRHETTHLLGKLVEMRRGGLGEILQVPGSRHIRHVGLMIKSRLRILK